MGSTYEINIYFLFQGITKIIPAVILAKPSSAAMSGTVQGVLQQQQQQQQQKQQQQQQQQQQQAVIRATAVTNLILKSSKSFPIVAVAEKPKSPSPHQNSNEQHNNTKVPNILSRGGTSSPAKINSIDRQIVSHEATIELKKNIGILSRTLTAVPTTTATTAITTTTAIAIATTTNTTTIKDNNSVNLSIVNGKMQPKQTTLAAAVQQPSLAMNSPLAQVEQVKVGIDLLQPINAETAEDSTQDENIDLAGINLWVIFINLI
jgi:transcription initiation factor TFIID subunit TAF12